MTIRMLLGQALRTETIGASRLTWSDLGPEGQEFWAKRADHVLRLLDASGVRLSIGDAKPSPELPVSPIIYSLLGHNPQIERGIRAGADAWEFISTNRKTSDVKILLRFTLAAVDAECDFVMSSDPSVPDIAGLRTRIAAANIIRKLNAEGMVA